MFGVIFAIGVIILESGGSSSREGVCVVFMEYYAIMEYYVNMRENNFS
jgi:hypothetical protein